MYQLIEIFYPAEGEAEIKVILDSKKENLCKIINEEYTKRVGSHYDLDHIVIDENDKKFGYNFGNGYFGYDEKRHFDKDHDLICKEFIKGRLLNFLQMEFTNKDFRIYKVIEIKGV